MIAWPVAVLIISLVAMIMFRDQIARLINRTRRISATSLEADAQPQEVTATAQQTMSAELQRLFDNALLTRREEQLIEHLDKLEFKDITDREKVLIRLLAIASITQQFERTYAVIWGSQLGALQALNTAGTVGGAIEALHPWYEQAAAREPHFYQGYTFEQWLEFLVSHQLVIRTEGRIVISIEGREFLKYVVHQGYTLCKRA